MPNRTQTKVTLTGPFFTQKPGAVIRQNIVLMLEDVSSAMEQEVHQQIAMRASSMPGYTGHTASTIHGRVESLAGNPWHRWAVVSANTGGMGRKEAIRTKAAASSIEGRWHPFRKVSSSARRLIRDLAKGLD